MSDRQNISTATFRRLADSFTQGGSRDVQATLKQAIADWRHFSTRGGDSVGALSPLVGTQSLSVNDPPQVTPTSGSPGDPYSRLVSALQDRLAALQASASPSATPRGVSDPAPNGATSLARASDIAANSVSLSLNLPRPSGTPGPVVSGLPDLSMQTSALTPPSRQVPAEVAQRMTQSAKDLLADPTAASIASAVHSPASAAPAIAERMEAAVAGAQQAPSRSRGSAVDTTSSHPLDRLRDAALHRIDPGETRLPFQSGLTVGTSSGPAGDRSATTAGAAHRDDTRRPVSQQGSDGTLATGSSPALAEPSTTRPLPPSPAVAADPHRSALAMIQSLKADARWNNQPTDVLKPLW